MTSEPVVAAVVMTGVFLSVVAWQLLAIARTGRQRQADRSRRRRRAPAAARTAGCPGVSRPMNGIDAP
ncbi:MAG: hypothetical protein M3O70_20780 [Actinomycetota bacterium]|nr:hypothetical protein [Actinomycetota bacterium]